MPKRLVFVWDDPKVRRNMADVMERRNFAPANCSQYVMFVQPQYRHKQDNEVLVFGTAIAPASIDKIRKLRETESLKYIAVNIEDIPQEVFHAWSTALLDQFPDLKFFDPKVGGNVFEALRSEVSHA
ncbi:hypothetical protein D3C71_1296990 [compost metagenome]